MYSTRATKPRSIITLSHPGLLACIACIWHWKSAQITDTMYHHILSIGPSFQFKIPLTLASGHWHQVNSPCSSQSQWPNPTLTMLTSTTRVLNWLLHEHISTPIKPTTRIQIDSPIGHIHQNHASTQLLHHNLLPIFLTRTPSLQFQLQQNQ